MTLRQDMLKAAHQADHVLEDSAINVLQFILDQQNPDGGFRGRSAFSDMYYTVFGLECIHALKGPNLGLDIRDYLNQSGDPTELDLVHLACLVRCWATVMELTGKSMTQPLRMKLLQQLESLRSPDGGFNTQSRDQDTNAYGCFMALGIYHDLQCDIPESDTLIEGLLTLQRQAGGFANDRSTEIGSTPATAAALCVLHYLADNVPSESVAWLLSQAHPQGGFAAVPVESPVVVPDLLSTATAIHALSLVGANIDLMRDACLDYLDSLWDPQGAFKGSWLDETLDCEYTYYGLLALGHLYQD
jgi:prenyltransferase beta subunit